MYNMHRVNFKYGHGWLCNNTGILLFNSNFECDKNVQPINMQPVVYPTICNYVNRCISDFNTPEHL